MTSSAYPESGAQPESGLLREAPQPHPGEGCHSENPPRPQPANSQHRGLLGLPLPSGAGRAGREEKHGPIHLDPQPDIWIRGRAERDRESERQTERQGQKEGGAGGDLRPGPRQAPRTDPNTEQKQVAMS